MSRQRYTTVPSLKRTASPPHPRHNLGPAVSSGLSVAKLLLCKSSSFQSTPASSLGHSGSSPCTWAPASGSTHSTHQGLLVIPTCPSPSGNVPSEEGRRTQMGQQPWRTETLNVLRKPREGESPPLKKRKKALERGCIKGPSPAPFTSTGEDSAYLTPKPWVFY